MKITMFFSTFSGLQIHLEDINQLSVAVVVAKIVEKEKRLGKSKQQKHNVFAEHG